MNRSILVFVAYLFTASTSYGAAVNFTGSDNVLSWYRVATPDFAGPNTVVSATNTVITADVDVDETAQTITFNSSAFDVPSDSASFGNSAVLPPGSFTPISISIRVTFDSFSGSLTASNPLALSSVGGTLFNIADQSLSELTGAVTVTGSYEVIGPDDPITGSFSVDMSPTASFPGGAQLNVIDFPSSIRFQGQSAYGDGDASLFFTTVGNARIIDTEIEGIPVFFDLNGWGANLTGWTSTVIPIPAAAWLFASALGLLGWLKRRAT